MKIINWLNTICKSKFLLSILCVLILNLPILGFLNINLDTIFSINGLSVNFSPNSAYSANATNSTSNNDNNNDDNDNNDKHKDNSKGNPNSPLCTNGKVQCPTGTVPQCMGHDAMNIPACFKDGDRARCCDTKGKCTSERIVCVASSGCAIGKIFCGGICITGNCCTNSQCASGLTCQSNNCFCPSGQVLCNGTCVAGNCCTTFQCNSDQTCQSNNCSCPSGKVLCNGVCVTGNCCTTSQCTSSQTCQSNFCTTSSTTSTSSSSGVTSSGCGVNQILCNNICITGNCCTTSQCNSGQICQSNSCTCPSGQVLCNGACVTGNCCTTSQCNSGQICQSNSCTCPSGQVLCGGSCITGNCCTSSQCTSSQTCQNNFCIATSTTSTTSSSSGTTTSGGSTTTSSTSSSGGVSSSGGLGTDALSLTIDVISTPKLPDVVQIPLVQDEFVGKIGVAYKGSNPSFEIRPTTTLISSIQSIDLIDRAQAIFPNIPFTLSTIPGSQDILILGLTLPDNLATGGASFIVHLANNNSLTGLIDILDFINIETVRLTENNKIIGEPSIVRLKSHNKSLHKIKVHLRGNDFVGRKILLRQGDGSIRFPQNQQGDPNTSITVYPSSLNLQVIKRSVSLNGKVMNIILRAPQEITETKSVVLVIATPRGIVSKGFVISPKVKKQ